MPAIETQEWLESLQGVQETYGPAAVSDLLAVLQGRAAATPGLAADASLNTPYVNTIPADDEPPYPGDHELEARIENLCRWNALAMVLRAQDEGSGVGGHLATYASAATALEVGFNHFFRAAGPNYAGDLVIPQPHAAPGIYARAYLEGRFDRELLCNYRRELQPGGGLSSYPHPRSMPSFWQVPGASMGLSTPIAIYQARFARYLTQRGLLRHADGKVWCFIGDGEADEPEVLGTINLAAREQLQNLVMIINCNLQRLDGPVRGNGKIIQELESSFRGAGWAVIKVVWGSDWDALLARDSDGVLRRRMEQALDGDYQFYSASPGHVQRDHWVAHDPALRELMASLSDDEIAQLRRGGQDRTKIYAAFHRAAHTLGKPTVVLIKSVKGDRLGDSVQGRNAVHQRKNLGAEERVQLARAYGIPLTDDAARRAEFFRPPDDSPELTYLRSRRRELGGPLPARASGCAPLDTPPLEHFDEFLRGSGDRPASTTMAAVTLVARLLKHADVGKFVVPIVPDEARTFGMDALFRSAGIYSPLGQVYAPVDAGSLVAYREARDGQILQEGICEVGAMASFLAAGSAWAIHGLPMIPFYFFYSMFGFQRVGDLIWAAGDMMCRGFLMGGTAGRTTLNGEGLQHQDGHSLILAATVPSVRCYDPAFAFELAIIVCNGLRVMYTEQHDVIYYLTVYNETYAMPAMPQQDGLVEAVLKGGYCFRNLDPDAASHIHLLASGAIMQQALAAADLLAALGHAVKVWSITSFIELERDARDCERWNRLNPTEPARRCYVETLFAPERGVFVAATDFVKSLPAGIGRWIPGRYEVLGTDGYGLSESRASLRDHFEVSARFIAHAALASLYRDGLMTQHELACQASQLQIDATKSNPRDR